MLGRLRTRDLWGEPVISKNVDRIIGLILWVSGFAMWLTRTLQGGDGTAGFAVMVMGWCFIQQSELERLNEKMGFTRWEWTSGRRTGSENTHGQGTISTIRGGPTQG